MNTWNVHARVEPVDVKPHVPLNYGMSEGEMAMDVALIAGAFVTHPPIARGHELIALLTPRQQAIYLRLR